MRPSDPAVYVVSKAPAAGACKTRLSPPLLPTEAARLARAFLHDAIATVQWAGLDPRVICRDAAEQLALARLLGPRVAVSVQTGPGLGAALESAFRQGLADGCRAVAVVGADSPTLPPRLLHQAFAALERGADVALGPCEDGGYYILAARALHRPLFRDMPWGASSVAALTLERCRALRLSVHRLPTWYDVDDASSLARLRADLARAPRSLAPRTRCELASMPALARVAPPVAALSPGSRS